MMTMQELSTMVQYDIPVVIVMANNCGWMAIKDLQAAAFGKKYKFGNDWLDRKGQVYTPDFTAIAAAFGVPAWHAVTHDELRGAIKAAIASGRPAMITVDVSRTDPYTGGEAFGWWDVPVPGYIKKQRGLYEAGRDEERWTL